MAFEIASVYFKKRADFGHECKHEHSQAMCIVEHAPTDESENLLKQTSIVRNLDTKPVVAQYRANTERKSYVNQGMTHLEGGWPKDVDATEQSDIARFRKRVEKNDVRSILDSGLLRLRSPLLTHSSQHEINAGFSGDGQDHGPGRDEVCKAKQDG